MPLFWWCQKGWIYFFHAILEKNLFFFFYLRKSLAFCAFSKLFQSLIAHTHFQSSFSSQKGWGGSTWGVFNTPIFWDEIYSKGSWGFVITDFFKGQSRAESFTYNYTEMIFAFSLETFFCIFASCNVGVNHSLGRFLSFFAAKPPCTVNDFFDSHFFSHIFGNFMLSIYQLRLIFWF